MESNEAVNERTKSEKNVYEEMEVKLEVDSPATGESLMKKQEENSIKEEKIINSIIEEDKDEINNQKHSSDTEKLDNSESEPEHLTQNENENENENGKKLTLSENLGEFLEGFNNEGERKKAIGIILVRKSNQYLASFLIQM